MVEVIPDMPPGTLGFRVFGRLKREDYIKVLVPPLRKAVQAGERLRVLYAIGPELHMEPAAVWEDLKLELEVGIKHAMPGSGSRSSPTSTGCGAPSSCSPGWYRVKCTCSARASSSKPGAGWRSSKAPEFAASRSPA